jgi:hypothetical protein
MFKSVGALVHIPLLSWFEKLIQWIIPDDNQHRLGIENLSPQIDQTTKFVILEKDIFMFYETVLVATKKRYADPTTYEPEQYYMLRSDYEKLFQFMINISFENNTK